MFNGTNSQLVLFRSKRVTTEPVPNTQVSSRTDIYEQEAVDEVAMKEDSQRMDVMMRQLMGGDDEEEEEGNFLYLTHTKKIMYRKIKFNKKFSL